MYSRGPGEVVDEILDVGVEVDEEEAAVRLDPRHSFRPVVGLVPASDRTHSSSGTPISTPSVSNVQAW